MQTVSTSLFLQLMYLLYFPGDDDSSSLVNFSPSHLQVFNASQPDGLWPGWSRVTPKQPPFVTQFPMIIFSSRFSILLNYSTLTLPFGEGNGNQLQCSCLENARDREAWWAAVCGVAQNRTQLKQLSSSSNNSPFSFHFVFYYFFNIS